MRGSAAALAVTDAARVDHQHGTPGCRQVVGCSETGDAGSDHADIAPLPPDQRPLGHGPIELHDRFMMGDGFELGSILLPDVEVTGVGTEGDRVRGLEQKPLDLAMLVNEPSVGEGMVEAGDVPADGVRLAGHLRDPGAGLVGWPGEDRCDLAGCDDLEFQGEHQEGVHGHRDSPALAGYLEPGGQLLAGKDRHLARGVDGVRTLDDHDMEVCRRAQCLPLAFGDLDVGETGSRETGEDGGGAQDQVRIEALMMMTRA